jgi:hypothetical protein
MVALAGATQTITVITQIYVAWHAGPPRWDTHAVFLGAQIRSRISAYCHLCNGIAFTGIVWQDFSFSYAYNEWLVFSVFIRETVNIVDILYSFIL